MNNSLKAGVDGDNGPRLWRTIWKFRKGIGLDHFEATRKSEDSVVMGMCFPGKSQVSLEHHTIGSGFTFVG